MRPFELVQGARNRHPGRVIDHETQGAVLSGTPTGWFFRLGGGRSGHPPPIDVRLGTPQVSGKEGRTALTPEAVRAVENLLLDPASAQA